MNGRNWDGGCGGPAPERGIGTAAPERRAERVKWTIGGQHLPTRQERSQRNPSLVTNGQTRDFETQEEKTCLARAASIWWVWCRSSYPSVGSNELFPIHLETVSKTLWIICRSSVSSFVFSTNKICRTRQQTSQNLDDALRRLVALK